MTDVAEFVVLHEFFKAARERLPVNTWDYVIGGAETETTLRRNREGIDRIAFRPRVLRDVSAIDPSCTMLGMPARMPVFLAPIGSLQDLEPGGGASSARGAGAFGIPMMLSSQSHPGLEATAETADGPKVYQLYVRAGADEVDAVVERAVAAGYQAFALTVDLDQYGRRERDLAKGAVPTARRNAGGHEFQQKFSWKDIERIKGKCPIPLIVKGIATSEDAKICVEHGVDCVYVSNHGGRQLDHGRGSIEVLPEVVEAVANRAEVWVDGGFLRGTDIVKARILGADAVGIGRLHGYALAAGGADGVQRMLEILEAEVRVCLGLLGVNVWDELDESYLHPVEPVREAHVVSAFPLLEENY